MLHFISIYSLFDVMILQFQFQSNSPQPKNIQFNSFYCHFGIIKLENIHNWDATNRDFSLFLHLKNESKWLIIKVGA